LAASFAFVLTKHRLSNNGRYDLLLLRITFLLSKPFVGPLPLSSDPFVHALLVYDSVDQTL
jgi:hypothetical protein